MSATSILNGAPAVPVTGPAADFVGIALDPARPVIEREVASLLIAARVHVSSVFECRLPDGAAVHTIVFERPGHPDLMLPTVLRGSDQVDPCRAVHVAVAATEGVLAGTMEEQRLPGAGDAEARVRALSVKGRMVSFFAGARGETGGYVQLYRALCR